MQTVRYVFESDVDERAWVGAYNAVRSLVHVEVCEKTVDASIRVTAGKFTVIAALSAETGE